MNSQQFKAYSLAAEAKRKGAIEATICRDHGDSVAVHIERADGSAWSEFIRPCGCVDTEVQARRSEGTARLGVSK